MNKLSKKYKQFSVTTYYKGIELELFLVTTSINKCAELMDTQPSYIKNYAYKNEPSVQECIENPDVVYAKAGLGGEARAAFDKDIMYTFVDFKTMIDKLS